MTTATVTRRCPTCGRDVTVALAPSPPTQWFPCPHCRTPLAVVVPREPPPLYSWEVVPGLYPALARPRVPRWRPQRAAVGALLAVAVLAAVFAGALTYYGVAAGSSGDFAVSGTVEKIVGGAEVPAGSASVALSEEGGAQQFAMTGADGTFAFVGVPSGGVSLNITLPGYRTFELLTFVSSVYDAGSHALTIVLHPGDPANRTSLSLSPFTDLESFLASVGTGVVLFGLVALTAALAVVGTRRSDQPALGVVGGGAGLFAPITLYLLGVATAFPLLASATATVAAFGGFALALRAAELARSSPAVGSD